MHGLMLLMFSFSQILFIASSLAIVIIMMKGHDFGRLTVKYDSEEQDTKARKISARLSAELIAFPTVCFQ